ncbi:unnamed protein product [Linum trigynum]|uniref:Protein kinase domain-containing protein n=1 Tax=Linum trigynum TaxID=586398 RepID=A0AAV2DAH8_9ROSI
MGLIRTIRRYLDGILSSRRAKEDGDDLGISFETPDLFIDLRTLEVATDCFSKLNKLGHGGFGPVYKGLMPNGQEVAVKKLSATGRQGVDEFTNEVKLLSEIRHMNLVTLLGCCAEGPEKMLVYEYLSNKSLDCLLFDKEKSSSLDWATRFRIVKGVARGLLYLHEEAPVRILHRDIKTSNILLDEKLSPKISDFGLAWLFPEEDTQQVTEIICGTYGYMAPEYVMHGHLSVKTDVFSYGIILLEIISGSRNYDFRVGPDHASLLHSAWLLYRAGKTLELVDPSLAHSYHTDEVEKCIRIGLLCCQQSDANRPDMNSIHVMLSSNSFTLPTPGQPACALPPMVTGWDSTVVVEDYSQNSISVSSIDEGR